MFDQCIAELCNNKRNVSGNGYCRRHYDEIRKYGMVITRKTSRTPNEVKLYADHAEVIYTDKSGRDAGSFIIDLEDCERIKKHKWSANDNGYIRTLLRKKTVYLHRYLVSAPDNMEVDHINHNKADNRKTNLRICEHYVNMHNMADKPKNTSYDKKCPKRPYYAVFKLNGKYIGAGYHATEQGASAAAARKKAEYGLG